MGRRAALLCNPAAGGGRSARFLIAEHSKRSFLSTMPKAFKGTHLHHRAVRVLRGRDLQVDADRPFDIYADGDPIGATPATIRVVPAALRVLVPA